MTSMCFARVRAARLLQIPSRNRRCFAAASTSEGFLQNGRLTHVAQEYWKQVVKPGDLVIDATCGTGRDALCLARLVGPTGKLLCFDVQQESIRFTQSFLEQEMHYVFKFSDLDLREGSSPNGPFVRLVHRSHSELEQFVEAQAKLVCFNLGYLPGGDKTVTTQTAATLMAVNAAMRVVQSYGLVTVIAYPGHPEGELEMKALQELCRELSPQEWLVLEMQITNRCRSPILFVLSKL